MSDSMIFPDDGADDGPAPDDGLGGAASAGAPEGAAPEGWAFEPLPDDVPALDASAADVPAFGDLGDFGGAGSGGEVLDVEGFEDAGFGAAAFGATAFETAEFDAPSFGAALPEGGSAPPAAPGGAGNAPAAGAPTFGSPFDAPDEGGAEAPDAYDVSFAEAATISAGPVAGPPAERAPERGGARPAPKRRAKDDLVLGLHVTPAKVYGLLVRPADGGYEPLRQFVRHRSEGGDLAGGLALSPDDVPGSDELLFDDVADGDVSVQFEAAAEIDFSAEFAGLDDGLDGGLGGGFEPDAVGGVGPSVQPIVFEVRDILEECASAGFGRPALAFAVGAPDVEYVEVEVPPEQKDKRKDRDKKKKGEAADAPAPPEAAGSAPVKRERLLERLPELSAGVDRDRVAFVPMTPRDRTRRYLAVVPEPTEPVAESLAMLREQSAHRKTSFRTIEAEVPLLVGLVRMTLAPEPGENTALVRVGAEDTVVLLLSGDRVRHYEKMQSVTALDGPDTVCSRVLLQQDVQGVGVVHNVVVASEEREKELVQGFAAFYPDARIETLREGLARFGLVGPYGPLAPVLVGAAGAALAGHLSTAKRSPFDDASLLPDALRKRSRRVEFSVGWHTLVVAAVLFMSVLYFSYLYVSQEGHIADAEQRLAEFPPEARLSAPALQARIDSLRLRQASLTASLVALDSLLLDTDRWTQTLLRTTRAAAATGGAWIEQWEPGGADVSLAGFATERGRVVGLAQRLGATIEEVTYQDIRGFPVYAYRLRFTQPPELPQVSRVLRARAEADLERAAPEPLRGLDAPAPDAAPPSP
ncbi:hypothetical protein RQM47_13845 [Rubrivirga sp. S365]|uniref:Uncharacterized protein n=1 Tax=Rubrivirga litoralis TaxID=3075598 RepID=A0ABU3BMP5_9BACT|nr:MULTISPECIES: hypothetical protein [unclassified Rubrivirga]MDT0630558.1 hypothetical protein [Rubrivirga sp. F394]MDT7857730.1 hypothetical protein [Rubrivirga sp. S365]